MYHSRDCEFYVFEQKNAFRAYFFSQSYLFFARVHASAKTMQKCYKSNLHIEWHVMHSSLYRIRPVIFWGFHIHVQCIRALHHGFKHLLEKYALYLACISMHTRLYRRILLEYKQTFAHNKNKFNFLG